MNFHFNWNDKNDLNKLDDFLDEKLFDHFNEYETEINFFLEYSIADEVVKAFPTLDFIIYYGKS